MVSIRRWASGRVGWEGALWCRCHVGWRGLGEMIRTTEVSCKEMLSKERDRSV